MDANPAASMPGRGARRGETGFLLMETLMAVFFLAVGITAVLRSYGSSIQGQRVAGDYTKALMRLEESLWKFEVEGSIAPGTYTGVLTDVDGTFHWRVDAVELPELDLCETRATVSWEKRGKTRDVSAVTYLKRKE